MDRNVVPKQQYVDTLDGLGRQRYLDKLRVIGGVDPYRAYFAEWFVDQGRSKLPGRVIS